jgi:hypothetical protein
MFNVQWTHRREGVRHEAKCFVLAVGVMLMVASAAGQQFQLMEASIIDS